MGKKEKDLYPEIELWLQQYLADRYPRAEIITTHKTSRIALDAYLRSQHIDIKEAIGLSIKVDIVGIIRRKQKAQLAFVEVKDKPLTLSDLGQLWGYTQLIDPVESFLVSSKGMGSLRNVLVVLKREDLLAYGKKKDKYMKVAKWDSKRGKIDYFSLIPKI